MKFPGTASFLKSLTTLVKVSTAAAPSTGKVLTAISPTEASWENLVADNFKYQFAQYEAGIVANDAVGLTSDGIMKCTTENKSSANVSASAINIIAQAAIDTTRTFFLYSVGLTIYGRVGTLSGDVMSYGTEVTIGTGSVGIMYGGCALINTDKIIVVYWDGTTPVGNLATHKVCSISGTTISQGTGATQSMVEGYGSAKGPLGVCKVRTDAYCLGYSSINNQYYFISTVSGTTVTVNSTAFFNPNQNVATGPIYLSDNFIGIAAMQPGSANLIAYIYEVNSGSTAIATTFATGSFGNIQTPKIARIGPTEYVLAVYTNTNVYRIPKPPSGTTITAVSLPAAPAADLPICAIGTSYYGIVNGTTLLIYSRSGEAIGSITGISAPLIYQYLSVVLGRLTYINSTNGTSRIINLGKVFYFGLASNTTGLILKTGAVTISGIMTNVKYYLQTDGTIADTFTDRYVGRGIDTNTLLVL